MTAFTVNTLVMTRGLVTEKYDRRVCIVVGETFEILRGHIDDLADEAKKSVGSGVVVFVAVAEGRATVVVGVTDDLTKRFPAGDLVTKAVQAVGGAKGGGRPDMAQGGGPDGAKADEAIAAVKAALAG